MPSITLGNRTVDDASRPYVIAEIGVNHEGSMDKARELIDLAKEGGADAAKFQTYKAETLASRNSPAYWDQSKEATTSQFALFKKYDAFGEAEYRALAEHAGKAGVDFISTPFDEAAVDFLDPLMPFFKIASTDITNLPLLLRVASKGKPVVLSTGASTIEEIGRALNLLTDGGAPDVALLHCVLNYPTLYHDANLGMITGLREAFPDRVIGYSDHTVPDPGMLVLDLAYAKGARVIEKHFTHDKTLPGNDHYHAMDVTDLKRFVAGIDLALEVEGARKKTCLDAEEIARTNARRSLVTRGDIAAGTVLAAEHIVAKRPATGISPMDWDNVIGKRTRTDLADDHILQWDDLID